ncbi:hypothetical protein [Streptomyces sp. NPDC001744]|uniref:hypothetical protein n=1 Tax=Streptomyces sp. NPDC001744 TaxID=3364606 RepID=UPI0036A5475D
MRIPVLVAVAAAVLLLGACGASPARRDGASRAALSFEESLASGAYGTACGLLAPDSREQLEEDGSRSCERALAERKLPRGRTVRSVDVYGRQALLRMDGETLFLSQFDDGWRVTAAGCVPEKDDSPHHCALKGA